jgi:hypothetical protein
MQQKIPLDKRWKQQLQQLQEGTIMQVTNKLPPTSGLNTDPPSSAQIPIP